jgi:hypothetical protein
MATITPVLDLYEILVPTVFGDTNKPVSTKHHKEWDAWVRRQSGGLTILTPARGQWIHEGKLLEERVIPVRIALPRHHNMISRIAVFTKQHYRQKRVMYFFITDQCYIE